MSFASGTTPAPAGQGPRNLAEVARAALTATDAGPAVLVGAAGAAGAVVADLCVRDGLGFVLLLHRRKDGFVAEELCFAAREDNGTWPLPEHLSGSCVGFDPADRRKNETLLCGRPLMPFGESETLLCTGRRQDEDDGHEMLRFHTLLVSREVDHLDIEDLSPDAAPGAGRIRKSLRSRVALLALYPGERVAVRPMAREGDCLRALGEPYELTGTAPGPA
ncbi:hypothetical protein [Streptomyces sp. CB01580]|uniref:hypothetical protein n=2 Tax=Streptomyces TaxID=1883 RepID=UPI0009A0B460|nr:hypothetical protein [Streptomyces sp. CB01580]